jgi:hypothetical protein
MPRAGRRAGIFSPSHVRMLAGPAGHSRLLPQPRPGHDRVAIIQAYTWVFGSDCTLAAYRLARLHLAATARFAGRPAHPPRFARAPGEANCLPARPDQKLVPPPAGAIISAEKKPARTIAYLTRGIKVGLMANRDDHVNNIPVVLSRRPARSGG